MMMIRLPLFTGEIQSKFKQFIGLEIAIEKTDFSDSVTDWFSKNNHS